MVSPYYDPEDDYRKGLKCPCGSRISNRNKLGSCLSCRMKNKAVRYVNPNGYVMVLVDRDSPMHSTNGYGYEHRVLMSQKIGRPLVRGEEVHHIDGNRANNAIENLELCSSSAEHSSHHRGPNCRRRAVGEANPIVACACGCGAEFARYDGESRPRKYAVGHAAVGKYKPTEIRASIRARERRIAARAARAS